MMKHFFAPAIIVLILYSILYIVVFRAVRHAKLTEKCDFSEN